MRLRIHVPGTLANLGSGYDTLGLAIRRYNRFDLEVSDGAEPDDLILQTARDAARRFGGTFAPFRVHQHEGVPRARGMGSSATARVAGLLAFMELSQTAVSPRDQAAFLADAEGHPDNAWPALFGGLVLCGEQPYPLPIASWTMAICIPTHEVHTPAARAALPAVIPHAAAVSNLRAIASLISGLAEGDLARVRAGVEDALHQPYRATLIGNVDRAFTAALEAGGAPFISGSGSTLAAFVPPDSDARAVAEALAEPFEGAEIDVLEPDETGATVQRQG